LSDYPGKVGCGRTREASDEDPGWQRLSAVKRVIQSSLVLIPQLKRTVMTRQHPENSSPQPHCLFHILDWGFQFSNSPIKLLKNETFVFVFFKILHYF
jgi:hypothetical protein